MQEKVKQLLEKTHENFLKVGAEYAGKGDLDFVREVLRQKPHWIRTRGSHGRTMLWEATNRNRKHMVAFLLEQGADIHAPGCHFSQQLVEISPYCLARKKGYDALADFLSQNGARHDVFSAAYLGDLVAVKQCWQEDPTSIHGAIPQKDMDFGRHNLLHYAVAGGHTEVVAFLVDKGARVTGSSEWILKFAHWRETYEMMPLLIAAGAHPDHLVISQVVPIPVRALLQKLGFTIDLNRPNKMGWPPIVYASRGDNGEHPEEIQALLQNGANIEARNTKGATALHTAAKAGFITVVQLLIDSSANLEAVDHQGETPIFYALRSTIKHKDKQKSVLQTLLKSGANPQHKNRKGLTAIELANRKGLTL